jgi:hypothetical protein
MPGYAARTSRFSSRTHSELGALLATAHRGNGKGKKTDVVQAGSKVTIKSTYEAELHHRGRSWRNLVKARFQTSIGA